MRSAGTPREIQPGTAAPDPKDRTNILKLLTHAEICFRIKDDARAAQAMEQALNLDPTNPRCHLDLGRAYEEMAKYSDAIRVFQHALEMKIATDKIFSRLGIDCLHLQDLPKAIEA